MPIKYDDKGLIKRPDKKINYTQEMIVEWAQCIQSVIYFAEHYYYVVHPTQGSQKIVLRNYQKNMVDIFQNHRFSLINSARQIGKTTCSAIYLLWYACFQKDKTIAILANKASTAKGILEEIKFAYEKLPEWLKPGVKEYNAHSVEFDNGCKIIARATSKDAIRGESVSCLFLDEFAFVPVQLADEFFAGTMPTLAEGGRCIIVSTPNGTGNLFYSLWKDANEGNANFPFKPFMVNWREVPGRDEKWEREMRLMIGDQRFNQEFNCLKGDSVVELLDDNGQIKKIKLADLYILTPLWESTKIRTNDGWCSFLGVKKSLLPEKCVELVLLNGTRISCTPDHEFFINDQTTIKCKDIVVDQTLIKTIKGYHVVKEINEVDDDYVYDVIEVDNPTHNFYCNDILTHNCQFQGSTITLIDPTFIIEKLRKVDPVMTPDEFTSMWKQVENGHKYGISCDIGGGIGSDFTIMNVFDITYVHKGQPAEQVAIWRCNSLPPTKMADYIFKSAMYWNKAYVIVEVNPGGYGDDVVKSLFDEYAYENLFYDIDRKEYGVLATKATKPKAAQWFKDDLEGGKVILYDKQTIDEIGYFEEIRENVFKAKQGRNLTDDCVMSCIWFSYFLHSQFFEGEKYDEVNKDTKKSNLEEWVRQHDMAPEEVTVEDMMTEEDQLMQDALEIMVADEEAEHDPDNWLFNSEMRRARNIRNQK